MNSGCGPIIARLQSSRSPFPRPGTASGCPCRMEIFRSCSSLQGNYSFSRFLTFTSLIQMDTSNTQAVSANLRLRYNYHPDSDLYIIYNVGMQFASIAPANPPQVRETRFAVKWTYSFSP